MKLDFSLWERQLFFNSFSSDDSSHRERGRFFFWDVSLGNEVDCDIIEAQYPQGEHDSSSDR
jgi:hypothetical protein